MKLNLEKISNLGAGLISDLQKACQRLLGPNGDLKVLAFIVAAVLFALVRVTIGFTDTYTVPVKIVVKAPGVALRDQETSEVEVTLKGASEDIQKFDATGLAIEIVIQEVAPDVLGELIPVRRSDVLGVGKLRVRGVVPDGIYVNYDREVTTRLKVAPPNLIGKPLLGEAKVRLGVGDVGVTGPDSKLSLLRDRNFVLPTEPVNVDGKTQNFSKKVRILPPTDSGITSVTPPEVEAEVVIVTPPVESIYTNEPPIAVTTYGLGAAPATNGLGAMFSSHSPTNEPARLEAPGSPVHQALPEAPPQQPRKKE